MENAVQDNPYLDKTSRSILFLNPCAIRYIFVAIETASRFSEWTGILVKRLIVSISSGRSSPSSLNE
jgi:hypothetical protein